MWFHYPSNSCFFGFISWTHSLRISLYPEYQSCNKSHSLDINIQSNYETHLTLGKKTEWCTRPKPIYFEKNRVRINSIFGVIVVLDELHKVNGLFFYHQNGSWMYPNTKKTELVQLNLQDSWIEPKTKSQKMDQAGRWVHPVFEARGPKKQLMGPKKPSPSNELSKN